MPSETQALFLVKMKIARPAKAKRQNRVKYILHSSGVSNWPSKTNPILPTMRLPRKPIKKSRIFLAVVFKGLFSSLFIVSLYRVPIKTNLGYITEWLFYLHASKPPP